MCNNLLLFNHYKILIKSQEKKSSFDFTVIHEKDFTSKDTGSLVLAQDKLGSGLVQTHVTANPEGSCQ